MSVVTAKIDIAAPPQEVWDFSMDPDKTLEWALYDLILGWKQ